MKTLIFEGVGWSGADISKATEDVEYIINLIIKDNLKKGVG